MTTFAATSQSGGVINFASGSFTSDNTITTLTMGFKPRMVRLFNETDVIAWEAFEGMGATITKKTVAAGTTTADATTAITITDTGCDLAAATVGTSKEISWVAM